MNKKKFLLPQISAESLYPEFITLDEARRLGGGESKSSIYRALNAGELHAVKRGRRTLLTLESVRNRLHNLPKATFGSAETTDQSSSKTGSDRHDD